jgi:IMP cyclohydrolase
LLKKGDKNENPTTVYLYGRFHHPDFAPFQAAVKEAVSAGHVAYVLRHYVAASVAGDQTPLRLSGYGVELDIKKLASVSTFHSSLFARH